MTSFLTLVRLASICGQIKKAIASGSRTRYRPVEGIWVSRRLRLHFFHIANPPNHLPFARSAFPFPHPLPSPPEAHINTNVSNHRSTKSTTARINGAKSHGPATPEGLTRSSRNALRHGLSASTAPALAPVSPVLPTESAADYQTLLHSYLSEFSPHGLLETELVETMAAARWRLRRVSTIETTLLAIEMDRLAEYIDRGFKDLTAPPPPTNAWPGPSTASPKNPASTSSSATKPPSPAPTPAP